MEMTINEIIEREKDISEQNQKVVDTHVVFVDDDGNNIYIEELYCDDTEVINEHLENYQFAADYHKEIYELLSELKVFRAQAKNSKEWMKLSYNHALDDVDNIITEQLDKSDNQVECQTLRWVLDVLSDLII